MTDNITNLPRRKKGAPKGPLEVVHGYGGCQHTHIEVSEKEAEVTCRDCKVKLNPIWVLMRIATDDLMLTDRWVSMKAEISLMRERKRVKCKHCNQFTPIPSHVSTNEIRNIADKIRREDL